MARANRIDEGNVVLLLDNAEAQFLRDVLYKVGGDPKHSQRRHQEPISTALRSVGMDLRTVVRATGNIMFENDGEG